MNFGSLQIVTAWRLTRAGVVCQGIVMHGTEGVRLVVIEDQEIVDWVQFRRIVDLRRHLATTLKARRDAGWVPCPSSTGTGSHRDLDGWPESPQPGAPPRVLLTLAELD